MRRLGAFLLTIVLIAGLVNCVYPPPFIPYYDLTISSTEGGSVTTPGEGTFTLTYTDMEVVELVAEADEGYRFVDWTGDVSTVADVNAANTTITMSDEYSITANFVRVYDLTMGANPEAQGRAIDVTNGAPYAAGTAVSISAVANPGYHFVNWEASAGTFGNGAEAQTTFVTPAEDVAVVANFGVDLYFQVDAHVWLSGPGALAPEARSPRMLLQVVTNMVVDSVRVELPGGGSVVLPRYTDAFSPGVDWRALFRFLGWIPGMPVAGAEYTFTGLDEAGEPVPGARDTDIWVGVEPPDPPANVRCELTDGGILVSWDEGPVIPGSFEPAASPQLGFYHFQVGSVAAWEVVYGAAGISASPHLIPRNKADFVEGKDFGVSLSELQDGVYRLVPRVISFAPQGSLGKGMEYNNNDPSQMITFTIEGGKITIG